MANKVSDNNSLALQKALLSWFDRHQRVMPWRATRGRRANPYHVWLSEIMLQQTTVAAVGPYFQRFIARWPRVEDLAAATQDEVMAAWAGLGYYARARNLHKCAQAVAAQGGKFPRTLDELQDLPGIGPYTAAAVASIAFDQPAVAVDGNVERVVSRFYAITDPLPASKPAIWQCAAQLAAGVARPGDFTQAFMELGATVCTPRKPQCGICPWRKDCRARIEGIAETLPRKIRKKEKPARFGHVYVLQDAEGRVLIEKRQGTGLYEGMYQLPTTEWMTGKRQILSGTDEDSLAQACLKLPKKLQSGLMTRANVLHSLTHFDLTLGVWALNIEDAATVKKMTQLPHRRWVARTALADYGIPQVMKKALSMVEPLPRKSRS